MFLQMYCGVEDYDILKKDLVEKCCNAGFILKVEPHSTKKQKYQRLALLHMICEHNRLSIATSKIKCDKRRSSRPTTEENHCSFELKIICNESDEHWYLCSNSDIEKASWKHSNHLELIPKALNTHISELTEQNLEMALACAELQLDNTTIARLVSMMSSGSQRFTKQQMKQAMI